MNIIDINQCSLLVWPGHIHDKKDTYISAELHFKRFTYVHKTKEIIFSM
jgi:hypothetical protein